MATQQRRGVGRPRGEHSTERPIYTSEQSLGYWIRARRQEFLALPEHKQRETIEHVEQLLAREGRQYRLQLRRAPSPLALAAFRVYGVWVAWLPAAMQLDNGVDSTGFEMLAAALTWKE